MFARGAILLVLSLLVPSALLAQSSDLSVALLVPAEQASADLRYVIWANWKGDSAPANVVLEATIPGTIVRLNANSGATCTQDGVIRCTVPPQVNAEGGVNVVSMLVTFATPGTYEASARVTSTTPDPQPQNNEMRAATTISARPSLTTSVFDYFDQDGAVDPGRPARVRISVQNNGAPATSVLLRGTLPEGGVFVRAKKAQGEQDPVCTVTASVVECHIAELFIQQHAVVSLEYIAPDHDRGGTFPIVSTVSSAEPEHDSADNTGRLNVALRKLFAVTTAADSGPGSLRQHIFDSRVLCEDVPCLIRIPAGQRIQPGTPLPQLWGRMKVEGGLLDGSLLDRGDALQFQGCELRVDAVTVVNFRGHAIEAHGPTDPATFQRCGHANVLTPVWVTNSRLLFNERGIVTKAISATITDNEIRNHRRAGIFVDGGYYTEIARNQITGNGASGIFIDARLPNIPFLPPGADIVDNLIRGNGEWGIARTANGSVQIAGNSIYGNLLYGIDIGLDLNSRLPMTPVLTSATYDAANNVTVIRGTATQGSGLNFYASASLSGWGYPEAERQIATKFVNADFEVTAEGDLRGQWITATATRTTGVVFLREEGKVVSNARYRYQSGDTSELSLPVRVQ